MSGPNVRLDVGQSIPAGYVVGRLTGGVGDAGLISIASLAGQMVSSGIVSAPGSGGAASTIVAAGAGIGVSVSGSTYTVSNSGVLSNVAGTGISVSGATGNVTITNSGVTSAVAGTGISVSGATGAVTFANTGVLSVSAGTGITVTGTTTPSIALAPFTSITVTGANGNSVSLSEINSPNFNFNETMKSYGTGANQTSVIELARARGTSASPAAVQSGDILGALDFDGYGTTGFFTGGNVQGVATETWTDTHHGTKLQFGTTANGAASPTSGYMTLDQDGGLVLTGATGGSQGAGKLNATGLFINGVAVSAGTGAGFALSQGGAWNASSAYSLGSFVSNLGIEYVNQLAVSASPVGTSFNPANTDASITLTNSNRSASKGSTTAWKSAVGLDGYVNTGKYYFEIQCVQLSTSGGVGIGQLYGLANSGFLTGNGIGLSLTKSLGFQSQRSFFYNGGATTNAWKGCVAGDVVGIAVDLANKLIWITNTTSDAGVWNNGTAGTQNPGTGSGGIAINATIIDGTSTVFPAWSGDNSLSGPDKCILNTASGFNGTIPSGFSAWGGSLFGNTAPASDTTHWIETGVVDASGLPGVVSPLKGGTGIANNAASTLTISGAFATTLTVSAATNSTLPSGTHTLAGLDVAQTWTAGQTFSFGADTSLVLNKGSALTTYNIVSLNGDRTLAGAIGLLGGATGVLDPALNLLAAASGSHVFFVGGTKVAALASGGLTLNGSTSGTLIVKPAAVAGSNTITLPAGTTDFSATGGTSQVVKQTSTGAAFTVGQLAAADLSDYSTWATDTTTVTATSGTFTTVSGTQQVLKVGKTLFVVGSATITTNGTAAGVVLVTFPASVSVVGSVVASGRGASVSGKMLQGSAANSTHLGLSNYDGTYPGSSGEVLVYSYFCQIS